MAEITVQPSVIWHATIHKETEISED